MTDERFVYNADLRDRKRTAASARAKKGNSRSCTLPSDSLSAAQKRKLNGPVESFEMNKPMVWSRLRALSPTLQFLYLDHLVNEHHARRVDLCDMLGVATCTFWKMQQALPGELQFRGSPKKPAPEWEQFMAAGYQHAPPSAAHKPTGGRSGAGVVLGGVYALRALRKRHGALYGLCRIIRHPPADRRSRPRK